MKKFFCSALLFLLANLSQAQSGAESLRPEFAKPPAAARLHPYWWWSNGNVSRETLTADLEAFKAAGMGGAIIDDGSPLVSKIAPRHGFMSPAWRELFSHAVSEAGRLGLTLSLQPASGYDYGGFWTHPEDSFQRLFWTETKVKGPGAFKGNVFLAKDGKSLLLPSRGGRIAAVMAMPDHPAGAKPAAVRDWEYKSGNVDLAKGHADWLGEDRPEPGEVAVDAGKVLELSAKVDAQGNLGWEVPAGDWVILALGHETTGGRMFFSNSAGGGGLHSDYLSRSATDKGFAAVVGPLKKILAQGGAEVAGAPGPWRYLHVDSQEHHNYNWNRELIAEFRKRRGYDPVPHLPTLAGRIVGSREIANRFLYDVRKTIGDMTADNFYGRLTALAHEQGLQTHMQAGGAHTLMTDPLKCLGRADVPMGEFWVMSPHRGTDDSRFYVKEVSAAAHVYGKKRVMLEAFSCQNHLPWSHSPYEMKEAVDRAFCEGGNWIAPLQASARTELAQQPGDVSLGGEEFHPNLTYWKQANAWFDYIARCSHLLQQGLFVGDVLYYYGDQVPNRVTRKKITPDRGPGYDYDVINAEALTERLSVRDGRLVLPDGMSYRVLVLPERREMPLEVLAKIKALVEAGAIVIGPRPERDPGLKDYPASDAQVREMAGQLWGDCDGKSVREHPFGKGRIVWGLTAREVLAGMGAGADFNCEVKTQEPQVELFLRHRGKYPDFRFEVDTEPFSTAKWPATEPFVDFIHRRVGDTEIYFLANRTGCRLVTECRFRVSGKEPELWNPVTGTTGVAPGFRQSEGGTVLPLELAPRESVFVVFQRPLGSEAKGAAAQPARALQALTGPWDVSFDPAWGGPGKVRFDELTDWTRRPEEGIRHYSGTAVYRKAFAFSRKEVPAGSRVWLDLGRVCHLAAVRLNGKPVGTIWCAPWRVDVTEALAEGDNRLEIEVSNLWPNRLTGDSLLPEEKRLTRTNIKERFTPATPLLPSGILGSATLEIAQANVGESR